MRASAIITLLVLPTALLVARAAAAAEPAPIPAAQEGPRAPAGEVALEAGPAAQRDGGPDLVLQARLQTTGKVVLGAAFAFVIAGIVLIEIDPYALKIGDWGFAAVGVGVSALAASAFVLGLTRPVHVRDHPWVRHGNRVAAAPANGGLAVVYGRSF